LNPTRLHLFDLNKRRLRLNDRLDGHVLVFNNRVHRFDVKLVLLIYFILLDELVGVMVLRSLDVQLLMQRLMLRPLLLSPSLILRRFLVLDLLNVVLLLLFFHWIYLEILVRLRERHVNLMSLLVWILLYILLIHISIEYLVLAWS